MVLKKGNLIKCTKLPLGYGWVHNLSLKTYNHPVDGLGHYHLRHAEAYRRAACGLRSSVEGNERAGIWNPGLSQKPRSLIPIVCELPRDIAGSSE